MGTRYELCRSHYQSISKSGCGKTPWWRALINVSNECTTGTEYLELSVRQFTKERLKSNKAINKEKAKSIIAISQVPKYFHKLHYQGRQRWSRLRTKAQMLHNTLTKVNLIDSIVGDVINIRTMGEKNHILSQVLTGAMHLFELLSEFLLSWRL